MVQDAGVEPAVGFPLLDLKSSAAPFGLSCTIMNKNKTHVSQPNPRPQWIEFSRTKPQTKVPRLQDLVPCSK